MPGPRSRWTEEQLKAIAADDPGGELYEATYALIALTDERKAESRLVGEADVLAAFGVMSGLAVLGAIESHVDVRVVRLIRGRGVDICHQETDGMIADLEKVKALDQIQASALRALGIEQIQRWPGIRAADLELARTKYAGG